jgi:hypothetical protein
MRMFRRRTKEWCEGALEAIDEAVATGANATSFQGQSVQWKTLAEAKEIMADLEARIDEIDGKRSGRNGIRWMRIIPQRGL